MSLKSSTTRYGTVAIAIHWITALAVLVMLVSGLQASGATDPGTEANLLRLHAIVGVTVLVLTLLRIVWFLAIDRRPAEPAGSPHWQNLVAKAVHGLLYLAILVLAASGIAMFALSGAAQTLFFGSTAPLPDFSTLLPRGPHGLIARLLMALIALHIGAALYHQLFLRDRLLSRMGLGR